jgi:kinesin family protein 15
MQSRQVRTESLTYTANSSLLVPIFPIQVREYEHDYECNKKLVDCREDKIARLEQLADGVMSESDFMAQERLAAQLERRAMQEKIDRHPEVTRFAMENMRLVEQLRR